MKTTTATLCAVLILSAPSVAQNPTLNPVPNTIFVGTDGKFETAPDTALIQYNISAQADSAKDAYDQAVRMGLPGPDDVILLLIRLEKQRQELEPVARLAALEKQPT